MDVDALVDAWKAQMHTGPKHERSSEPTSEGNEKKKAAHDERQSKSLMELQTAGDQKYELEKTRGELMDTNQRLNKELDRFRCGASLQWIRAMEWHVDHLYEGTFLNMGRWGAMVRMLSGNSYADRDIANEHFPVEVVRDEYRPYASTALIQHRDRMRTEVPDVYTFVEETLLNNGFLVVRPPSPLPAQDPYAGEDDGEEGGVDDDAQADVMPDVAPPRPDPKAYKYETLLKVCIDVLPDKISLAKEYLSTEDHSMFSHSYDYLLQFNQEGGAIRIPEWRSYFYRAASKDPSQQDGVPLANRNADIAALFRSMVLWSVVLASEAKNDAECSIAASLNSVPAEKDGRYDGVIAQIRRLHAGMLSRGEDMASETTAERYKTYTSFVNEYAPSVKTLVSTVVRDVNTSPLVDLLVCVCEVGLALMAARYASGRTTRDESGFRTSTPLQMMPFPIPVFRKKYEIDVLHTADDIDPEPEIMEDAGTDLPDLPDSQDSQTTITDGEHGS